MFSIKSCLGLPGSSDDMFEMLRNMHPARMRFIKDSLIRFYGQSKPFSGLNVLDCGCGIGILSESMHRLCGNVVAIDENPDNILKAKEKAVQLGMDIDYRVAKIEYWDDTDVFDVVAAIEVIEHVDDAELFLLACAKRLKKGGLIFISTMSRTFLSLIFAKFAAEYVLRIVPQGTHEWAKFIGPGELRELLARFGVQMVEVKGMKYDITCRKWELCDNLGVNYIACGVLV